MTKDCRKKNRKTERKSKKETEKKRNLCIKSIYNKTG